MCSAVLVAQDAVYFNLSGRRDIVPRKDVDLLLVKSAELAACPERTGCFNFAVEPASGSLLDKSPRVFIQVPPHEHWN